MFDRWLPHVTAGVAYGTRNANGTVTGVPSGTYNASDTSICWAAGVGVDYAITQVPSGTFNTNGAMVGGTAG